MTKKELLSAIEDIILNDVDEGYNPEDVDVYSDSGGNYDDAYEMGLENGRTELANKIYELLKDEME